MTLYKYLHFKDNYIKSEEVAVIAFDGTTPKLIVRLKGVMISDYFDISTEDLNLVREQWEKYIKGE